MPDCRQVTHHQPDSPVDINHCIMLINVMDLIALTVITPILQRMSQRDCISSYHQLRETKLQICSGFSVFTKLRISLVFLLFLFLSLFLLLFKLTCNHTP